MNFEKDLREQINQLLNEDKIKFNERDSICGLLISYLNALNRRIPIKKRKVLVSDNVRKIIDNNKLDKKYIDALLKFKVSFEKGTDMVGHLSANVYCADVSINNRQSRDYLIDDWGIHHLHLNEKEAKSEKEMRGKINGNRSEYLLFVKVADNEVYFIDILNHNDKNVFAKQELIETLDRNWHSLLEEYNMSELLSVSKLTDKEVNNARQNGEYKLYNINKKVYRPMGGGLTSAGTNIIHTDNADRILDDIKIIEEDLKNNYTSIKNEVEVVTGKKCFNKNLEFKFSLEERGYVVKEINTDYAILYFYEGNYFKKRAGIIGDKYKYNT